MTFHAIDKFLIARPGRQLTLVGFVLVMLIGMADHLTGYEISFSVFYLIPIAFSSWYVGKKVGLSACLASALTWLLVDKTSGHPYSAFWIPFWNAFTRLILFVLVAFLLAKLREILRFKENIIIFDGLTGVKSRRAFMEEAGVALNSAARHNYPVSLGYIDLDGFKALNDTLGHAKGDEALKATGHQINLMIRGSDLGARIGGDEFVVLLPHTDRSGAENFFARLHGQLQFVMKDNGWPVGFTIGVAVFSDGTTDVIKALQRADALMLGVKKSRKNSLVYAVFDNTNAEVKQRVSGNSRKTPRP